MPQTNANRRNNAVAFGCVRPGREQGDSEFRIPGGFPVSRWHGESNEGYEGRESLFGGDA